MEHADTEVLPVADPEVYTPVGQDVQDDDPGEEAYVPEAQIVQLTIPLVDQELSVVLLVHTSVDEPEYPAEHDVYA